MLIDQLGQFADGAIRVTGKHVPLRGQEIVLTARFTVAVTPAALTVNAGSGTAGSALVAVSPVSGAALNVAKLVFSCQGTLPPWLSCSFSAPVSDSNGSAAGTLNVSYQPSGQSAAQQQRMTPGLALGSLSLLGLLLIPRQRRGAGRLFMLLSFACLMFSGLSGCGTGAAAPAPQPAMPAPLRSGDRRPLHQRSRLHSV